MAGFPLASVSRVCTELAPEVGLNTGAARTALRRHVQAAHASQHNGRTAWATERTSHDGHDSHVSQPAPTGSTP